MTADGGARVYLDHNASAPVRPEALAAATEAMACAGNASSVHGDGRRARALLEDARDRVAALAGAAPRRVIFTSGATEANNLALAGSGRRLLVSAVEHPSVLEAAAGGRRIPVDGEGLIDLAALERLLREDEAPALVSVMAANNETGALQPLGEAIALARRAGALVHCDAVQAAGRSDGPWREADLISLSGHKLGGVQGAGALIVRDGVALAARQHGGGQELGRRAGTEALPAIAAFGAAARAAPGDDAGRLARWRDGLERAMLAAVPGTVVLAAGAPRLANTLCAAHPAIDAETMVIAFDLAGISISAGAACSSGKMAPSHVAAAMGRGDLARRALRFSFGWSSGAGDAAAAAGAWRQVCARLAAPARAA